MAAVMIQKHWKRHRAEKMYSIVRRRNGLAKRAASIKRHMERKWRWTDAIQHTIENPQQVGFAPLQVPLLLYASLLACTSFKDTCGSPRLGHACKQAWVVNFHTSKWYKICGELNRRLSFYTAQLLYQWFSVRCYALEVRVGDCSTLSHQTGFDTCGQDNHYSAFFACVGRQILPAIVD